MRPHIDETSFGSITIDGQRYEHDVVIGLNGEVRKRKKKLSKKITGTSHVIAAEEMDRLYEPGAKLFILGTGQYGVVTLSEEAKKYCLENGLVARLAPTPEALNIWNAEEGAIGLFHVTC